MRKRFVSVIMCVSLIVSLCSLSAFSVNAASNDTRGISSWTTYYIKNLFDGKYLDVYNGGDANAQDVWTYTYNQSDAQKWTVIRNSDGTYTFHAEVSTNNRVLDVTDNNVDIWTHNSSWACQKFIIERNETYAYGGMYYIKYGSNFVIKNVVDETVSISSTGNGTNALWSFIPVDKDDADIYSFNYWYWEGILYLHYNSTNANSKFETYCENMGYSAYTFVNKPASTALNFLKYDSVWVHSGHGNVGRMAFVDDEGNWSRIYCSDINALATNELASVRVVISTGCSTGGTSGTGAPNATNNIIYALYNQGVHFALGWTDDVNTAKSERWLKNFFEKSDEGGTVKESLEHADYWANCGTKYYYGDVYQQLSH